MRRVVIAGLAALALAAQKPEEAPEATIKVDVDVVNLFCSVRDKNKAFIKDLHRKEFAVYEDGKAQEIRYFTRETDLPLTIGLLVDVSKSQENLIEIEKRAAYQFFQQVLRPKDMAFLVSFGADAELLQDYTNSARSLQKALNGLRLSTSVGGLHPGPVPTSKPRGTILFDAIYLAATEKLRSEVGRKVIVVISDGMDFGSRVSLREAVAEAHKSDTIIYSIYYYDPGAYGFGFGGGSDGDLRKMSEETGGRLFKVSGRDTLELIFKEIQEEMRSQYAIGYTPSNAVRDGGFRKVEIKLANKDYRVQARKGYFAPGPGGSN